MERRWIISFVLLAVMGAIAILFLQNVHSEKASWPIYQKLSPSSKPVPAAAVEEAVTVGGYEGFRKAVSSNLMDILTMVRKDGVVSMALSVTAVTFGLLLFLYRRFLRKEEVGCTEEEEA